MLTPDQLAAIVQTAGVVGVLLLNFWLLATGKLVWRREFEAMHEDRDWWRTRYLNSTTIAHEAVAMAKEVVVKDAGHAS